LNAENITVQAAKQACILGEGKKNSKKAINPKHAQINPNN